MLWWKVMVAMVAERAVGAVLHRMAGKAMLRLCFFVRYKLGHSLPASIDDIEVSND